MNSLQDFKVCVPAFFCRHSCLTLAVDGTAGGPSVPLPSSLAQAVLDGYPDDPCVGIRAVPVGEAMMASVLADHYLRHRGQVD